MVDWRRSVVVVASLSSPTLTCCCWWWYVTSARGLAQPAGRSAFAKLAITGRGKLGVIRELLTLHHELLIINQPYHHDYDLGFSITPQDADILQEYLQEFQAANTSLHSRIIEKAMAQLYLLCPASAPFDKKVATKRIQKWFYNHYVRPRCEYIKFTRKWSARNAFYHLHRDEVLEYAKEESGREPGHPAFLGALQDATTALWNEVSPEDQEEYVNAAKEWLEKTPPKHVQSRYGNMHHL
ncbi:hypothetical protein EDB89DRAFT_2064338 [Lactarius sanguifluus]|nr:hypothetical protein EDB89DRAFT_2064338 [Lactarius sanguifluus]